MLEWAFSPYVFWKSVYISTYAFKHFELCYNKPKKDQTGISNNIFIFQSAKEPSGLFMPFQVKKDTRLAPEHRQKLSDDQKERLDSCVNNQVHIL